MPAEIGRHFSGPNFDLDTSMRSARSTINAPSRPYLSGAVCPDRGAGAALVLPACNSEAMQRHLDEIATKVATGRPRHSHS
jgi:hypothetical protein